MSVTMCHTMSHCVNDRCILLTTESLDEAEGTADNVIVMVNGKVICNAPPNYLCKRFPAQSLSSPSYRNLGSFGAGYVISCTVIRSRDLTECMDTVLAQAKVGCHDWSVEVHTQ